MSKIYYNDYSDFMLKQWYQCHDARKPVFGVPTRSDRNWAVKPQKLIRDFKYRFLMKRRNYTIYVAKTKALISCVVIDLHLCIAYANSKFSHDVSQISKFCVHEHVYHLNMHLYNIYFQQRSFLQFGQDNKLLGVPIQNGYTFSK